MATQDIKVSDEFLATLTEEQQKILDRDNTWSFDAYLAKKNAEEAERQKWQKELESRLTTSPDYWKNKGTFF